MVRKSVVVGLGLWILAVASVAAIAWLAIETAGSQVSAVAVAAPMPSLSGSQAPVTSSASGTAPGSPTTPSKATASSRRSTVSTHIGSVSTDGGRVRARCTNATVSLDGGFARPEPGWRVRVHAVNPNLWVMFGSQSRAITVLAKCADGRPSFTQRSQSLSHRGAPIPPGPSVQDAPAPPETTTPPVSPAPTVQPLQRPTAQPLQSVTPTALATPDPAQVAAYVTEQNDMCAQSGWSTDWCRTWQAMSDQERYALAQEWLTSLLGGGDGAAPTAAPTGAAPTGVSTTEQMDHGPGPTT